jgi:hypothetical protein
MKAMGGDGRAAALPLQLARSARRLWSFTGDLQGEKVHLPLLQLPP